MWISCVRGFDLGIGIEYGRGMGLGL